MPAAAVTASGVVDAEDDLVDAVRPRVGAAVEGLERDEHRAVDVAPADGGAARRGATPAPRGRPPPGTSRRRGAPARREGSRAGRAPAPPRPPAPPPACGRPRRARRGSAPRRARAASRRDRRRSCPARSRRSCGPPPPPEAPPRAGAPPRARRARRCATDSTAAHGKRRRASSRRARGAGAHRDGVDPEGGDLRERLAPRPLAHRRHRHHRGHAEDDAEDGEAGAQLVEPEAAHAERGGPEEHAPPQRRTPAGLRPLQTVWLTCVHSRPGIRGCPSDSCRTRRSTQRHLRAPTARSSRVRRQATRRNVARSSAGMSAGS